MIIYAGFLYIILSSIYTFTFAGQAWKDNHKAAAIGAVLLVFISMGLSVIVLLRS